MLRFQVHVKNIHPAADGERRGSEPPARDGPIEGDNAGGRGRIPPVVLEFPPA
jgi:hypothetical protein